MCLSTDCCAYDTLGSNSLPEEVSTLFVNFKHKFIIYIINHVCA